MTRTCLDLFSGLGGFSEAFRRRWPTGDYRPGLVDWDVVTVDIGGRFDPDIQADVMDLRPSDLPDADVVLASPPCTCFSLAANGHHNHFDGERPMTADAKDAVALVYHTLGLIHAVGPDYWFMENPRGKLRGLIGLPTGTVTLCQYGYDWQKPTDLWGHHPPMEYRTCAPGNNCHLGGPSGFDGGDSTDHERDPAERAKVPYDLSLAIRGAVEDAYANPPPEQSTLTEAAR